MCVTFLFDPFCIASVARMLLQGSWTMLGSDCSFLLTSKHECINIVRHRTLLYITPERIPYCTEHDASVQRLNDHMDALRANTALGPADSLSEDDSTTLDRLNALINVLKSKYYHTDEWILHEGIHSVTRIHKRPRRSMFTPERSDCPIPLNRLTGTWVTHRDFGKRNVEVTEDVN